MQPGLLLLLESSANNKSACRALLAGSRAAPNRARKEPHKKKESLYRPFSLYEQATQESSDFATLGTLKETIQALGKATGWAMCSYLGLNQGDGLEVALCITGEYSSLASFHQMPHDRWLRALGPL